jgi:hypothetical protein
MGNLYGKMAVGRECATLQYRRGDIVIIEMENSMPG